MSEQLQNNNYATILQTCLIKDVYSVGCGPVVRLLGCHARAQRSAPHCRESGI